MKKIYLSIITAILLVACGTTRQTIITLPSQTLPLELKQLPPSNIYINLDYGIRLNIIIAVR